MTSSRSARRRPGSQLFGAALAAVLAVGVLGAGPVRGDGVEEPVTRVDMQLWDGVSFQVIDAPGPVSYAVTRVFPGAPVKLESVISGGRVGERRERVSAMCSRVGGITCVNANYATCPSCATSLGAVVRRKQLFQTPVWFLDQVRVTNGRLYEGPWEWSARVQVGGLALLDEPPALPIDGINTGPLWNQIVLSTRHFGATTHAPPGTYEVLLRAPGSLWTGGTTQPVEVLGIDVASNATIPADGMVLSARGTAVDLLKSFVKENGEGPLDLVVDTPDGLENGISGHPVLLRDGERPELDPADGKVVNRHPRTLLGWDDDGSVWLVVVEGRQERSIGMTLYEATDLMASLGATAAVNLDGGGSSALVTGGCGASGWCLRTVPSDGYERPVWVGLAVVPA